NRGLLQEPADVGLLALEHLRRQEVDDVAVATGKGSQETGGIVVTRQRHPSQTDSGRPAFRSGRQRRDFGAGELRGGGQRPEELLDLFGAEPQVGCSDLSQLTVQSQAGDRQGRIASSRENDGQVGGPMRKEMTQRRIDDGRGDDVVAVDDDRHAPAGFSDDVDQRRDEGVEGELTSGGDRPIRCDAPGEARSMAATTYRQNRIGSLSASSNDSHPSGSWRVAAHSATAIVLPNPAGALTNTTPVSMASSSWETRRRRGRSQRGDSGRAAWWPPGSRPAAPRRQDLRVGGDSAPPAAMIRRPRCLGWVDATPESHVRGTTRPEGSRRFGCSRTVTERSTP